MAKFTTKKINSITLGEKMKRFRQERRLSLGEISRYVSVQTKYLQYLEEGQYSKLPAPVYVKGFLRNYAYFANMNPENLIKQYEREQRIQQNINQKQEMPVKIKKPSRFSNLVITPKVFLIFASIGLVFLGFFYVYRQVNNFISTPRLVIKSPMDGSQIDGRFTRVSGVAEKDSQVFVNDQAILVSEEGEFSEDIGLREGLNKITVKVKNKFNKETNEVISVSANYQNEPTDFEFMENGSDLSLSKETGQNGTQERFSLDLWVKKEPTWVSVEADEVLVYSGVLLPDSVQNFSAEKEIRVTSGKGNNTFIKLSGKSEEILSEEEGAVHDLIFTPDGRAQM